jgi:hypothetical protein
MTKSVQIETGIADVAYLKTNRYRLCLAKKVNGIYNVVWQSHGDFVAINSFSWMTPVYQVFGSTHFQTSARVVVDTNLVAASLGERVIMDQAGHIGPAEPGADSHSITFVNQDGPIHPGLQSGSIGPGDNQVITPIYLYPQSVPVGTVMFAPIEKVQVWFAQNLATGTIIDDHVLNAVEIDLTTVNSAARRYQNGNWL